jgi:Mrp family chromosome partitioning ATPase
MVAARAPHNDAAEQYRTLRTRIAQSENGHARRVLVVTSPAQGDVKSDNASNLALTMAQEIGRRTVLMDADRRRPGDAGRPADRPAELLGTTAMRRTLDALRSRFDRVLIDTPPVLPLADVGVLAPYADGVLLVVRAGATPKPLIERALASFDAGRLLGVVLNDGGGPDETPYAAPRA